MYFHVNKLSLYLIKNCSKNCNLHKIIKLQASLFSDLPS